MRTHLNVFGIDVIPSDPRDRHDNPEVRPLIDGSDFIEHDYYGAVCGDALRWLLPDGPFAVGEVPHEVEMAAWCCCRSALDVVMRREGDTVVWACKEPEDTSSYEYRFDAGQYDAEVARATRDRGWEWPSAAVARELEGILRARATWLDTWTCEVDQVWATPGSLDEIRLALRTYALQPGGAWRSLGRIGLVRPVTDEDPLLQAERLAREITAVDPRTVDGMRGDTPGAPLMDWLGSPREFGPSSHKWS
ncbi:MULTISPECIES: hypothetical protein [unclassified Streptomyces]|uniref:hypothetical protein n=1 Tax=unclassified Streptomyces TaxID=2593676 RepID=UPI002E2F8187|nr:MULTISPECIES: hypothetical protein [unclassified Streptomyces]WUC68328.1 hypothetical protein OG861_31040 [Streptomyces sp. NBC_00539]